MSEPKFTPGPLTAEGYHGKDDNWFIRDRVGKTIAGRGTMLSGANATLYAAAPDLYAALDALQDGWGKNEIPAGAWAMCRSALAKARGQA